MKDCILLVLFKYSERFTENVHMQNHGKLPSNKNNFFENSKASEIQMIQNLSNTWMKVSVWFLHKIFLHNSDEDENDKFSLVDQLDTS